MLHLMKPNNLKIGDIGVYRCTLKNSKIPLAGHGKGFRTYSEAFFVCILNTSRLPDRTHSGNVVMWTFTRRPGKKFLETTL